MTCGLFSSFDPCLLESGKEVKWLVCLLPSVFSYQMFSFYFSNYKKLWISSFLNSISQNLCLPRLAMSMLLGVGVMVFLSGLIGLIPFSFCVTSHLAVTLALASGLWFSGFYLSLKSNWEVSVAHLLPKGSPAALWPFLVLIESVSLFIRPFTLAIRLMSNVMAGHLILTLIGKGSCYLFSFLPSLFFSSVFLGFEVGVALVQAYVFVSLLSLYWGE